MLTEPPTTVYRGSWCPFCIAYIKSLEQILPQITQNNGKAVIITSEPSAKLEDVLMSTKYTGEAIVDADTSLARELKKRNIIDVALTNKRGYPHGMEQPAVLVLRKGVPLYSWAIEPSMMNLGGAKDRPLLGEVWEDVQKMLEDTSHKPRQNYTKTTLSVGLKQKIFGY